MKSQPADYDGYVQALASFPAMAQRHSKTTREIAANYDKSVVLANTAVEDSEKRYREKLDVIEGHLRTASDALKTVGEATRIPPRIKPSAHPVSATQAETDLAIESLAHSTAELVANVERVRSERERILAQPVEASPVLEPPSTPRDRPRGLSQRSLLAIVGACLIATTLTVLVLVSVIP